MTKQEKRRAPGNYPVGYGKPPATTQFKKGTSGNPAGRPVGRKSVRAMFEEVLQEPRVVTLHGRRTEITNMEAVIRDMTERAHRGDHRARGDLLKYVEKHGLLEEEAPETEQVIEIHIGFHGPKPGKMQEERRLRTITQENDPSRLPPSPTSTYNQQSNTRVVQFPPTYHDED